MDQAFNSEFFKYIDMETQGYQPRATSFALLCQRHAVRRFTINIQ